MDNTFLEIYNLIKGGPVVGKENIFINIFDIILSCTGEIVSKQYFSEDFVWAVLQFTGSNSPYSDVIYKILTNIFSNEDLSVKLTRNKAISRVLVNMALQDILDNKSINADSGCMLMSNITRSLTSCAIVVELITPLTDSLQKLQSAFSTIPFNVNCSLDQLAMVLCNLSQETTVRKCLTKPNPCILQKLVPFMNHENSVRRRGIIGVVHNCAFDSSIHEWMLSVEIDILPRLLLPLAGPEQFDDEDNEKLPIDLQYLPDTKTREPNPEIRKQLLETLNQLCATRFGRQFLRDRNAYIILRELHKWEDDPSVLSACENVVDILIRTEDEIGIDQLNTVEIPADVEHKLNKEMES